MGLLYNSTVNFRKQSLLVGLVAQTEDIQSRTLNVTLVDDTTPIDLTDKTIVISFQKPDGVVVVDQMDIISAVDGTATYVLLTNVMDVIGQLNAQIFIQGGGESLSGPIMIMKVIDAIDISSAIAGSDDTPILLDLIDQVNEILAETELFMLKTTYDIDDNGVVDDSEALNTFPGTYYLDRDNHTGTQLAATISNFDAEVENNGVVDANKTYREIGHIPTSEKGAINGVATLDASGDVPIAQIPPTIARFPVTVTDTLLDGTLTVTVSDAKITADSFIEIVIDNDDLIYLFDNLVGEVPTTGQVVINTASAPTADIDFTLIITN